MLDPKTKQRYAQPYFWTVIVLGMVVGAFNLVRLDLSELGLRFALISIVTLAFGSRVYVKIPRVRGEISVSDTFIFFVLLLFGGEAAILLAGADAFCSSLRISKKRTVMAFNAAVYICSTFLTVDDAAPRLRRHPEPVARRPDNVRLGGLRDGACAVHQ